jgi:hypothetical protein
VGKINDREFTSDAQIYIYIYIYIYIKPEDIAIFIPCDIYGNVFISTRVIFLRQITPHGSKCVILLGQITPRARILLVKYEILYDILKLLMNYINMNLNVNINLTN